MDGRVLIAMAFLESAVVVYLRTTYLSGRVEFPLVAMVASGEDRGGREIATSDAIRPAA